jgi:hypothetical protein
MSTKLHGFDGPSTVAIARRLAAVGAEVRGGNPGDVGSCENDYMAEAFEFLSAAPPDIARALEAADKGVAHAWRLDYVEDRDEAWMCAAVAALLRKALRSGGAP